MTVVEITYVTLCFLQNLLLNNEKRTNSQHMHLQLKGKFMEKRGKKKKEVKKRRGKRGIQTRSLEFERPRVDY